MGDSSGSGVPLLLWPFYAIWRFLTFILEMIGRLLCAMLGIGLRIPLASLGFLLLVRAIF
jgi:hypothetical protein